MLKELDNSTALRIINSLKDGVPSIEDIQYYSASQSPLDSIITSDIKEISSGNYGIVRVKEPDPNFSSISLASDMCFLAGVTNNL
jgi:hypothetical protein